MGEVRVPSNVLSKKRTPIFFRCFAKGKVSDYAAKCGLSGQLPDQVIKVRQQGDVRVTQNSQVSFGANNLKTSIMLGSVADILRTRSVSPFNFDVIKITAPVARQMLYRVISQGGDQARVGIDSAQCIQAKAEHGNL
jgi:hypothetical protein